MATHSSILSREDLMDRGTWWATVHMHIFEISSLSVASFAIIFSHSESCLFTLLIVPFVVQKLLILIRFHLFIFTFISNTLGDVP